MMVEGGLQVTLGSSSSFGGFSLELPDAQIRSLTFKTSASVLKRFERYQWPNDEQDSVKWTRELEEQVWGTM